MAIYHLTASVISRARGQSAVAAAAYRSGTALRDERYGITHRYGRARGAAAHSEIMAPDEAPPWARDREVLWNRVEAAELRKDAQLARVIEVGLPIELTAGECVALVREYVAMEFVSRGMIADLCIRRDNPANPQAQMLLTLRRVAASGFGPKERTWNGKSTLLEWRSAWALRANEHLAVAGHGVRIDHRTLDAQHVELTPARRVGFGQARHVTERMAERQRIAQQNGAAILEDASVLLRALTHQWPTFTDHDLARFLQSRTAGTAQFDAAYRAVHGCPDLVALTVADGAPARFTSRDMIEAAKSLNHRAMTLASRRGHGLTLERLSAVSTQFPLPPDQRACFEYLVRDGDAKAIVVAQAAKSALLTAVRHAWGTVGLTVTALSLSRTAAANLEESSGIKARTLEDYEEAWQAGRDLPTRDAVLLVDGAEMIGLKALERILAAADQGRAKVALLGDSVRMAAMRADSPFRALLLEIGYPAVVV